MNDQEYKQTLHDLIEAVSEIESRRKRIDEVKNRKREIFDAMARLLTEALSVPDPERKWAAEFALLRYNVHFRLPSGLKQKVGYVENQVEIDGKIGFFFYSGGYPNWKVRDYNSGYRDYIGTWSDQSMLLIIDYAEDIIHKARIRMKLKKYRDKYDLNPLIDVLHSLSVLRGDTYLVRPGTPPVKVDGLNPIDPVTGKKRKQRARDAINIPFKIKSVVVGT